MSKRRRNYQLGHLPQIITLICEKQKGVVEVMHFQHCTCFIAASLLISYSIRNRSFVRTIRKYYSRLLIQELATVALFQ